jgi:hypothetical protein
MLNNRIIADMEPPIRTPILQPWNRLLDWYVLDLEVKHSIGLMSFCTTVRPAKDASHSEVDPMNRWIGPWTRIDDASDDILATESVRDRVPLSSWLASAYSL